MLVECAYGEGGTGMAMVCSKPARTISIPLKSVAARWSETWIIRRLLRTAAGSASSGAAGVCIGGTPASCNSRSLSCTEPQWSSHCLRASEMIPRSWLGLGLGIRIGLGLGLGIRIGLGLGLGLG